MCSIVIHSLITVDDNTYNLKKILSWNRSRQVCSMLNGSCRWFMIKKEDSLHPPNHTMTIDIWVFISPEQLSSPCGHENEKRCCVAMNDMITHLSWTPSQSLSVRCITRDQEDQVVHLIFRHRSCSTQLYQLNQLNNTHWRLSLWELYWVTYLHMKKYMIKGF